MVKSESNIQQQLISLLLLLGVTVSFSTDGIAQTTATRTFTKSATFSDFSDPANQFRIMNINGSVTIEAYEGESVELTVNEEINGSSNEIAKAKQELKYKLEQRGNTILAYLDAPFITIKTGDDYKSIGYNINWNEEEYQFIHNVHVKVPRNILVNGSTINRGTLTIRGPFKKVKASNVNGEVNLENISSKTSANTVNGDITISYDQAPDEDSEYQTVNGTIKIMAPSDLSTDVYFKSMHGELYTDFENVRRLTPEINKKKHSGNSSVTYRIDQFHPLRIGSGGTKLRFKVLNGNVYLQKQS